MKIDRLKELVTLVRESTDAIQAEIDIADKKGVFAYPRSKNIRKEALELGKNAKNIRESALLIFKSEGGKEEE